ncbi:MAG: DUF4276 family protein [Candidatus Thermoplasmatota archaeon]|nr:DUF4276 family protein [Euryarchaeota archaeon]MBU4144043.1 DUF4276 family protein [Candidatus Thermoplasmatota archaeon]MBU4591843.1 DUF4276 family protein [Candidatus Thermoplasmatota archaeon]
MNIEFLVEDESTKIALQNLLPKMLPGHVKWSIHPFQGKHDLLKKLPTRLKGYRKIGNEHKIVVILDRDLNDCHELKQQLERIARSVGFTTKSQADNNADYKVMNRIAIEELEAWFFGDNNALSEAFPGVPTTLYKKAKFRNPDLIQGTCEQLETVLKRAGYYKTGLDKREASRKISEYMNPRSNRSKSFQVFRAGLNHMVQNLDRQNVNGAIDA